MSGRPNNKHWPTQNKDQTKWGTHTHNYRPPETHPKHVAELNCNCDWETPEVLRHCKILKTYCKLSFTADLSYGRQTDRVIKQQKVSTWVWDIKSKKETKGQNDFLFFLKKNFSTSCWAYNQLYTGLRELTLTPVLMSLFRNKWVIRKPWCAESKTLPFRLGSWAVLDLGHE